MTYRKSLLATVLPLLVAGCATIKNVNISGEFDKSSRDYIQQVRWQEFESAANKFVTPSLQEAYKERIKAAGEVKVADYRVKVAVCDPEKGEATTKVEFDYYRPPSLRVLTVEDVEKWSYEDDHGSRVWRLKSLPPEFK